MASTVVSCAPRYDQAVIAHVGDSRSYQIRDHAADQLTGDHIVASERRRVGIINIIAAEQSEFCHVLTRSLGPELFVKAEISTVGIRPGDVLILYTDGLHGAIEREDLVRISSQRKGPDQITREVVQGAVEADGLDNRPT